MKTHKHGNITVCVCTVFETLQKCVTLATVNQVCVTIVTLNHMLNVSGYHGNSKISMSYLSV